MKERSGEVAASWRGGEISVNLKSIAGSLLFITITTIIIIFALSRATRSKLNLIRIPTPQVPMRFLYLYAGLRANKFAELVCLPASRPASLRQEPSDRVGWLTFPSGSLALSRSKSETTDKVSSLSIQLTCANELHATGRANRHIKEALEASRARSAPEELTGHHRVIAVVRRNGLGRAAGKLARRQQSLAMARALSKYAARSQGSLMLPL